eukprot:TRINITY_DN92836_c0_g1_i1.p1 TRINITY_DN92836_c0_g1~~TRINITY_DN92836_c0_g1_i1.p1  ORF type:complete len:232 (+),score=4.35 TRINITY_DN92836_c0_g1_i1:57-752(+)
MMEFAWRAIYIFSLGSLAPTLVTGVAYDFSRRMEGSSYHDSGRTGKALRLYHPGCNSGHYSRSPECVAAISRFCSDQSDGGGISQEVGSGVFGVACFEKTGHFVKVWALQAHHSSCRLGRSQSAFCISAARRWCNEKGYGDLGLPQEVGSDELLVACFYASWYGDVPMSELREQHCGCDGGHKAQTAACVAAMHRWCNEQGKGRQGLAQEIGNGVLGVGCFYDTWYGDVRI